MQLILCVMIIEFSFHVANSVDLSNFAAYTGYSNNPLKLYHDEELLQLKHCDLIHLSYLSRHGERFPTESTNKEFNDLAAKLSTNSTIPKFLNGLKSWIQRQPGPQFGGLLSNVGKQVMRDKGERMHQRTKSLQDFTIDNTEFMTTSINRTQTSGLEFLLKLSTMDKATLKNIMQIENKLIKFDAFCPRYTKTVWENPTVALEYTKFLDGPEINQIKRNVERRLRVDGITKLTSANLIAIDNACAFDIANKWVSDPDKSIWCQIMTNEERKVLEYLADLEIYYTRAYAHEVNYMMACPLAWKMANRLKEAQKNTNKRLIKNIFAFGHFETIIPVATLLKFFQPNFPPTASNYQPLNYNRWKSSVVSPFSANVALNLYACPSKDGTSYQVLPLYNEKPVKWALCNKSHCSLEELLEHLTMCSPARFNFDDYCNIL